MPYALSPLEYTHPWYMTSSPYPMCNPSSPPNPSSLPDKSSLFYLRRLQGSRIRQCYGCNSAIRRDLSLVPPQPHDIVICHKERRYYRDGDRLKLTGTDEPVHYHFMQQCVKNKHPSFIPSMLYISGEIMSHFTPTHVAHLRDEFGITL